MAQAGSRASLGVVIPVYNEAANIGATLEALTRSVKTQHRIHIVHDFEEDDTLPVARVHQRRGLDIDFVLNPARGVANAIKVGLAYATEPYLLVSMADNSDDYRIVDAMCARMDAGADIVCGSRYMRGGHQRGGPLLKRTLSRLAGVSMYHLARLPTHDATNSFKLYRRRLLEELTIESDGGFEIAMEIVVKAHRLGRRIDELPALWTDRAFGQSRFNLRAWIPKYLRWYLYALRS